MWIKPSTGPRILGLIMLSLFGFTTVNSVFAAERGVNPQGPWIVIEGRPAPWVSPAMVEMLDESMLVGSPVEFWPSEVSSPSVLGCREARYEKKDLPPEGLFQGNLPSPAESTASSLGFSKFPVKTIRVTCAAGVYDYHHLTSERLLIAVDNVLWTLVPARSNP